MDNQFEDNISIHVKAMMFDYMRRYGTFSSDIDSIYHLLLRIMSETVEERVILDIDFFQCQAEKLQKKADGLCQEKEVEWLILFECSRVLVCHYKLLIEKENDRLKKLVDEERKPPHPEGYLKPDDAFTVLYEKLVEDQADLYDAFTILLQYDKGIHLYLDYYGEQRV